MKSSELNLIQSSTISVQPYNILGQRPEDYIFGANDKILKTKIFTGSKISYLPSPERQSSRNFDTYACVSYSFINAIEINFKRLIELQMISADNLKWLENNGYFINGEINFSDRFLAVMSGTRPGVGNSGAAVSQSAREIGLAPQTLCDWNGEGTEAEYYDKSTISQKAKDTALEFKKRFNIQYEWVGGENWDIASQYGTLQLFVYAWFKAPDGVRYYNPNPNVSNHGVCEADLANLKIFDTYEPYIKQLTERKDFLGTALAIYVSEKSNTMSNVKIVKDTNSKTVYMALPVKDEKAFESYCENYGIEIKKHGDYTINWKEMLNGSITIS